MPYIARSHSIYTYIIYRSPIQLDIRVYIYSTVYCFHTARPQSVSMVYMSLHAAVYEGVYRWFTDITEQLNLSLYTFSMKCVTLMYDIHTVFTCIHYRQSSHVFTHSH